MFKNKPKKEKTLTVRITQLTLDRIKLVSERYNISQSEVIETLIDNYFEKFTINTEAVENDAESRVRQ
jgi:NACalpha-BTF3-like transcription factor